MTGYISIKESVLQKLEENLSEIRDRFGIDRIGLFGSVSRGEDTAESDIDLVYTWQEGKAGGLFKTVELCEYLESLFGRKVDLVSLKWMKPGLYEVISKDIIQSQSFSQTISS